MRRSIVFALVLVAILGGAGYGLFWSLQTCRPLDRLFGISGCAEVIKIADFKPLGKAAISAPDADGVVSIFGHDYREDAWQPALVRLELESGRELARLPFRASSGYGQMIFAEDGRRAIVICVTAEKCFGEGQNAAIVDIEDGAIIETRRRADDDFVYFPGDPHPEIGDAWVQLRVAGGERTLSVERDDTVGLLDADGKPVATLFDGQRNDILRSGVSVSPSGNRVALFDYARPGRPARLFVWEALTGTTLVARELGDSYRWRVTPAWTPDETMLTLVRRNDRDTFIELHHIP